MGRRKIEIKCIEKTTKRQQTYSNRQSGILKKARELSILCDAQVCLIMFSNTGKLAEYISPSTTMKDIFDRYEKKTNVDLSASEYEVDNKDLLESLQRELRKQELINSILRKDIRQRTGPKDLGEFSNGELCVLEEDLQHFLASVRQRKDYLMTSQKLQNNIRFEEARRRILQHSLFAKREEQGSHVNALNAVPSQVTFKLQPCQPGLQDTTGGEYFNSNSLL
ncbi:hypothetical protein MKX03_035551 [Papaver bracteatum]|nr:hypothetical protein MKX03_035551 [Papaver bracteatum]